MAWLENTLHTTPRNMNTVVNTLTAQGFSGLVMVDQQEFGTFL